MSTTLYSRRLRSVKDIRTHSGKVDKISFPYKAYMRISCLELEKARRINEREGAMERIRQIDERISGIDAEKTMIQKIMRQYKVDSPVHPDDTVKTASRSSTGRGSGQQSVRNTEGFKIRY